MGRPSIKSSVSHDRKLDILEEDDEDRIERERLATTLKLMGLPTEVNGNASSPRIIEDTLAKRIQTDAKPASTFSRFSAFFGRPTTATSPSLTDDVRSVSDQTVSVKSPEPAASFGDGVPDDTRGAEGQNLILAQPEPEPLLSNIMHESRLARAKRQTVSSFEAENMSETLGALHQPHRRTVGGDASLSTLWSLGSDGHDL